MINVRELTIRERRLTIVAGVFVALASLPLRAEAQADDAAVTFARLPSALPCGARFQATVRLKNTGATKWTAAEGYALGAVGNEDPLTSRLRIALPDGVAVPPGAVYNFSFTLTAPPDSGTVVTDWQMVREFVAWFGDTAYSAVDVQCEPPSDGAAVIGADLPVGLGCGESYAASVTVLNTGNTIWTSDDEYKLGSVGDSDPLTSWTRVYLPDGVSVPPGGTQTFAFTLTAPAVEGSYWTDWRMVHDLVGWFGGTASQTVKVKCPPVPVDGARVVTHDLPVGLGCGQEYAAAVTIENTGTTTWSDAGGYGLGAIGDSDPLTAATRIPLPSGTSVPPGGTHTFALTLVGPSSGGPYVTDWQMVRESAGFFGETASRTGKVVCSPTGDSAVVSNSQFPEILSCGATYPASITIKNTGTSTWNSYSGYALRAVGGSDPFVPEAVADLPDGASVPPEGAFVFRMTLQAPSTAGTYRSDWQMARDSAWFGDPVSRDVVVECPGADNAQVASSALPAVIACGGQFQASVTMANTGTTTWTAGGGYKLGAMGDSDPFFEGVRVTLPEGVTVPPGATHTFTFLLKAPAAPLIAVTDWRMVREGVSWFGKAALSEVSVKCLPPDQAQLIDATLPEKLACGASFKARVTLSNTGTSTWTAEGSYRLGAVGDTDPFTQETRVYLPDGVSVPPGATHTFEFTLTGSAALPSGPLGTDWQMVHDGVGWFGDVAKQVTQLACGILDDAQVTARSLPSGTLSMGATYAASVTVFNSGNTTWAGPEGYALGAVDNSDPFTTEVRVPLPDGVTIPPGGSHTFLFRLRAPTEFPQSREPLVTDWQMVREYVAWFGQIASSSAAVSAQAPRLVELCPDLLPDSAVDLTGGLPAASSLNACIRAAQNTTGVLEIPAGTYLIDHQVRIERPLVFGTRGTAALMRACEADGLNCAKLLASPSFGEPPRQLRDIALGVLFVTGTDVRIHHIVVDGNKDYRGGTQAYDRCSTQGQTGGTNIYGNNIQISGPRAHLTYSVSKNALCGTGLGVRSPGAVITNNVIRNNGTNVVDFDGVPLNGLWSDGLTLTESPGATVQGNDFIDNTDVSLISSGGPGGTYSDNFIRQREVMAFAGLMLTNFAEPNQPGSPGDFTGITVEGNRVVCTGVPGEAGNGGVRCHIGMQIGQRTWYGGAPPIFGGTVRNNFVKRAGIGINVDAAGIASSPLKLYGNQVEGTLSPWSSRFFACVLPAATPINIHSADSVVDRNGETETVADLQLHNCIGGPPRTSGPPPEPSERFTASYTAVYEPDWTCSAQGPLGCVKKRVTFWPEAFSPVGPEVEFPAPALYTEGFASFAATYEAAWTCTGSGPGGCRKDRLSYAAVYAPVGPDDPAPPAALFTDGFVASHSAGDWSACSVGCGGGIQSRAVTANGWKADAPDVTAPPDIQVCNMQPCAPNNPPSVGISTTSVCNPSCQVTFTATATDPDGDAITVNWTDCASGTGLVKSCMAASSGELRATATAADAEGATASGSASAAVVATGYSTGAWVACTGTGSYTCTASGANGCARAGTQTRTVTEAAWSTSGGAVQPPPAQQACTETAYGYVASWSTTPWSSCPVQCGGGWQNRTVSASSWTSTPPNAAMPADEQICNNWPCTYTCYDYGLYETWAECYGAGWPYCETRYRADGAGGWLTCRRGYE